MGKVVLVPVPAHGRQRAHPKPCCSEWEEGGCWDTGLTGTRVRATLSFTPCWCSWHPGWTGFFLLNGIAGNIFFSPGFFLQFRASSIFWRKKRKVAPREGAQVLGMWMGRFGGGGLCFSCLLKHPIALIEAQSCACFSWNYRSKLSVIMWNRTGKPLTAKGASSSDLLVFTKARWHFTSSQGSDFLIRKLLWFLCS